MRRVLTWLLWAVAGAAAVLLLIMVIIPRLMGWVPLTVLTGSMEPTIPPGSQVFVKPVESPAEISNGDVITYMPNPDDPTLVTHRVVGIGVDATGEQSFTVQGDANNAPDPQSVLPKQIKGVMVYHLPYVGFIALAISGNVKIALITAIGIGLIGYALWQLVLLVRDRSRRSREADRTDDRTAADNEATTEEVLTDA